jgi:hypothetical protein
MQLPVAPHPVDLDEPAALVVQLAARWHDRVPELGSQVVCVVVRLVEIARQRAERQLRQAAAAAAASLGNFVHRLRMIGCTKRQLGLRAAAGHARHGIPGTTWPLLTYT